MPSIRIGIPEMFREGRFEQVLITTFGADLEFYERVLRRHFGHFRNQIVLAHGDLLDQQVAAIAGSGGLRHLNRSWLAGPVRLRHAAHAKVILLAGPEAGLLLVGSGNLNLSGYAGAGECFTPYHWNLDNTEQLSAFTTVRSLTDGMAQRGYLDDVTVDRLGVFWSAYDWWHADPIVDGPVRHNLDVPLGTQFVEAVGEETVTELIIATPFHDPSCAALERLIASLQPRRVKVLAQPGRCSVDPARLAAVAARHKATVHGITAAGDLDATYLHAKIILAKTRKGSVCLTGSANCSIVALWTDLPNANIEVGNLASGPCDAFDHLLDPSMVTISGPTDPADLELEIQGGAADDEVHEDDGVVVRLVDVRWRSPRVHARVSPVVHDPNLVSVRVGGRAVEATITLEQQPGSTGLTIELIDAENVRAVDEVAVVSVSISGVGTAAAVPYQVERLREQDRRRVDADRLRHAAHLELDDPDLEHALAALEEILVGDNVARWGRDTFDAPRDADGGTSIAWGDIDWSSVRRNPRFTAYGDLTGHGQPGSDLTAYLDALSRVVRELLDPDGSSHPSTGPAATRPDDEDGEGDVAAGYEGANIEDEVEEDEEPAESSSGDRRQSPAARNRRLIRNFVRRNLKALEQPEFRAGVGPGVVIPNAIILNWVCWWVATKNADGPDGELVEERIRLWTMLWGTVDGSLGYLDELDDEHRLLVLERFDQQAFEAVTIASIGDVWAGIPEATDPEYRNLRKMLRRAVTHPCWQVGTHHITDGATLTNLRPSTQAVTSQLDLASRLWEIGCEPIDERDDRDAVASAVGTDIGSVTLSSVSVVVDGRNDQRTVREMRLAVDLVAGQPEEVLAVWSGVRESTLYRVVWPSGIAFFNMERCFGLVVPHDGPEIELDRLEPVHPPWRAALDGLYDAIERLESRVA